MRKLLLSLAIFAIPLAACVPASIPTPSTVAETTVLDEQVAITAHLAYKTWRLAVELGINAGKIKGPLAHTVAGIDNQLFAALQTVDAAYATGNAASYKRAAELFTTTLTTGYSVIGGR